jgi:predicted membrane-bound dolichyl-phosphate-mannose-protein mannosyltransferase
MGWKITQEIFYTLTKKNMDALQKNSSNNFFCFQMWLKLSFYSVDHTKEDRSHAHGLEDTLSIGRKSAYEFPDVKRIEDMGENTIG